jgi:hydroxyacylglutathione hydrolase
MITLLLSLHAAQAGVEVLTFSKGFTNVHALRSGDSVVLVDTHYARNRRWLTRKLAKAGIGEPQIKAIVVTHAHGDHAGGALALHEATGAPVIIAADDLPAWTEGHNPPLRPTGLLGALVWPSVTKRFPPMQPTIGIDAPLDLRDYGVAATVERVGGHTDGSVVVRIDGGGLVVGDLVRGGFLAPKKPREHFFQPDEDVVHAVLGRVLTDDVTVVYTGHGGPIPAGDVREWLAR